MDPTMSVVFLQSQFGQHALACCCIALQVIRNISVKRVRFREDRNMNVSIEGYEYEIRILSARHT